MKKNGVQSGKERMLFERETKMNVIRAIYLLKESIRKTIKAFLEINKDEQQLRKHRNLNGSDKKLQIQTSTKRADKSEGDSRGSI